jgi:hypothetical protein
MMFSVAAAMTATSGASGFDMPVFDRETGGFFVNDFRRFDGSMIGLDLFETTTFEDAKASLTDGVGLNVILPEGVNWTDFGFIRAQFDFPQIVGVSCEHTDECDCTTYLANLPVACIITQDDLHDWADHRVHIDTTLPVNDIRCNTQARTGSGVVQGCNDECAWDLSAGASKPSVTSVFRPHGSVAFDIEITYVKMTIILNWEETDPRTPGSALVHLLDLNRNVIPLLVWCDTCNAACTCSNGNDTPATTEVVTTAVTPPQVVVTTAATQEVTIVTTAPEAIETTAVLTQDAPETPQVVQTTAEVVINPPTGPGQDTSANEDGTTDTPAAGEKVHKVLDSFKEWKGSGNAVARIDAKHTDFQSLTLDGKKVDSANYTITEGSTVVTINEAYLKTLSNGNHNFVAEFAGGYTAALALSVNAPASSGGSADDGVVKGGIALAIAPTFAAAAVAAVLIKKRK